MSVQVRTFFSIHSRKKYWLATLIITMVSMAVMAAIAAMVAMTAMTDMAAMDDMALLPHE